MNNRLNNYIDRIRALSKGQRELLAEQIVAIDDSSFKQQTGSVSGLTAFVVLRQGEKIESGTLQESLAKSLPDYMIPSDIVVLDSLPLTPNGKLNRQKLVISAKEYSNDKITYVEPENSVETALQHIWQDLLNRERIGVTENFFHLGGHSLLATQLVSRINSLFNLEMPLNVLFEKPTVRALAGHIDSVRGEAFGIVNSQIEAIPRSGDLPLSFAQQRLWFLERLVGPSPLYNIPQAFLLKGEVDVDVLKKSINEIIQRHEILRTTFSVIDGQPVQYIKKSLVIDMEVVNLSKLQKDERDEEVLLRANEEAQEPFDLENGPLIRIKLLHLEEQKHALLLTMHHIVFDGWSTEVFNRELSLLYKAHREGQPSSLQELPIQYADFAAWQRQWLQGKKLEEQINFWKEQIGGAVSPELPTDHPRPLVQTFNGAVHSLQFSPSFTEELNELSRKEGVTLFMLLLSAFQSLLHRYTGQDDIIVGTPIANRNRGEIEGLIGFFVNTLVMHTDISGNQTFRELLKRVRKVTLDIYAHQDMPFEKLVEELQPERDLSRNPLFQVMFVLQNAPSFTLDLPGLVVSPISIENTTARFDIEVYLMETPEGLGGGFVYNRDLFDAHTIERMSGHFQTLLNAIVKNPDQRISELSLMKESELHQMLTEWNDTATDYPGDKCINQLFEVQVEKSPDAVALSFNEQRLTYRELNDRANQLAHYLIRKGVGPEIFIGVCIEQSLEMVIGIVAILKAGGAYVPLDPEYPKERLAFMLEDTGIPVILTRQSVLDVLPEYNGMIMCLDSDLKIIEGESKENPLSGTVSSGLAYVMYTSGSTGRPKGVCVPHRAISRLVINTNYISIKTDDRIAQASNFSFDAATFEIWGALLNGACLVGMPKNVILMPEDFKAQIEKQGISVLFITTALFNQIARELPEAFRSLRYLLFGGEAADVGCVRKVKEAEAPEHLLHVYGPTESTTFASWYPVGKKPEKAKAVPIGSPVSNTTIYILDKAMQPVPVGVTGELFIGGYGLATGYLNRHELSGEKFISDPFSKEPGSRLYRTGDLAHYLPDGNIEFEGRIDQQIKIRGYRIEPGEVEAVIARHPDVRENIVIAREDNFGGKRLVAYVVYVSESTVSSARLRNSLKETLPGYMIPSAFVTMDSLPLTPNGKVDRSSLPKPEYLSSEQKHNHVAPRNTVESTLVKIWEKVLDLQSVGVRDNFFMIGGHSMLAAQLIAEIKRVMGKHLPLRLLYQAPTIEQLAECIKQEKQLVELGTLVAVRPYGSRLPLFFVYGGLKTSLHEYLAPDQPLYVLTPQGEDGEPITYTTVEDMASYHIREIRAVQAEGPYTLGGFCFGGTVALEMAQQLLKQGEEVSLLFIVEPAYGLLPAVCSVGSTPSFDNSFKTRADHHLKNLSLLNSSSRIGYVRKLAPTVFKWFIESIYIKIRVPKERFVESIKLAICRACLRLSRPVPKALRRFYRNNSHFQAIKNYNYQGYPGKLILFMADYHLREVTPEWNGLAAEVKVHIVKGVMHRLIIEEPNIRLWAVPLSRYLNEIQRSEDWQR